MSRIPEKNPNMNCLEGMRCPNCGDFGPFNIIGRARFHVTDEGVDESTEIEWSDIQSVHCPECNTWHDMEEVRDAEKKAVLERKRLLEININWYADDIDDRANDIGFKHLTEEDLAEILLGLKQRHDCNIGINWDVIDTHIEEYCAMRGIQREADPT